MRAHTPWVLLALLATGCHVHVPAYGWPVPGRSEAPLESSRDEIHVKEIKAGRVSARVIYAKEVKARDGRVGRIYRSKGGNEDWGGKELNAQDVSAEYIYAKEIHADWVEADEIHAKEVKIGR